MVMGGYDPKLKWQQHLWSPDGLPQGVLYSTALISYAFLNIIIIIWFCQFHILMQSFRDKSYIYIHPSMLYHSHYSQFPPDIFKPLQYTDTSITLTDLPNCLTEKTYPPLARSATATSAKASSEEFADCCWLLTVLDGLQKVFDGVVFNDHNNRHFLPVIFVVESEIGNLAFYLNLIGSWRDHTYTPCLTFLRGRNV